MKINKYFIILFFISILAFALRFYHLSSYPPLLWDEASLGYNAFSLLKTAKDEYGSFLPFILKSFGDYKPPLYTYLSIPFIALFGLNQLSIRLLSLIVGSLTPLFSYFLVKQINKDLRPQALLFAFLIAINPFNIHFSRGAWESNLLTFELILASYFFFKSLPSQIRPKIKLKFLFLSALIFGLSLYTYQAAKMMSLFLIFSLLLANYSHLQQLIRKSFIFLLPLAILSLPILFGLIFGSDSNRLKVVSLFSYPRPSADVQQIIQESDSANYQIFHSQPIFFTRNFFGRYFNHFSPRYLIFEGDWQNPRHSAIYTGVILYPSLIFFIIGFFSILNLKSSSKLGFFTHKSDIFFLLWLIFAPIPAALTRDSVQSVRAMSLSIPLMYFTALGIFQIYSLLKQRLLKLLFIIATSSIYLISFAYYSDLYYNHTVIRSPHDYLYGYTQAMQYFIDNLDSYDNVYFTNFYGQPYIYYLFLSQYPPKDYQQTASLIENNQGDTGTVENIGRIKFQAPNFDSLKDKPSTLVIYSNDEILRQGLNNRPEFSKFIPLSQIGQISTFYAYHND